MIKASLANTQNEEFAVFGKPSDDSESVFRQDVSGLSGYKDRTSGGSLSVSQNQRGEENRGPRHEAAWPHACSWI